MSWKDTLEEGVKQEVEKLESAIAERDQKLSNAGQELASNRTKKQELEAERDALTIKLKEAEQKSQGGVPQALNVEDTVRKILGEKEVQSAAQNRATAEARFKSAHPEFGAESDPSGVKFDTVKGKLARFSLNGLSSVEDFLSVYSEAYTLVNPARQVENGNSFTPFAASPSDTGAGPRDANKSKLSAKEKRLVDSLGWTEERFMKQLTARPHYVKALLDQME